MLVFVILIYLTPQFFLAMETLSKEDHDLDLSDELFPFLQMLFSSDYISLMDDNVLSTLNLAHMLKLNTAQLDAACHSYILSACSRPDY